jgi:hypothetical protein
MGLAGRGGEPGGDAEEVVAAFGRSTPLLSVSLSAWSSTKSHAWDHGC